MLVIKDGRSYDYHKTAHDIKYINWKKESLIVKLDDDEWDEKIDFLYKNCYQLDNKQIKNRKTVRKYWHSGDWHFDEEEREIFLCLDGEYFIYTRNDKATINDKKDEFGGSESYKILSDDFEKRHGFKCQKAFGAIETKYDETKIDVAVGIHHINRCNGPFIGADKLYDDKITEGVCKADVSSAYPKAGSGRLPDAHDYLLVRGYEEPTAEYPFAFYLKSGHIAEYGVFDTHKDQWSALFGYRNPDKRPSKKGEKAVYFSYVPDDEETTVLMKASKWELTASFERFYVEKCVAANEEEKEMAKAVMNKAIGRFDYVQYKKRKGQEPLLFWDRTSYMGHIRAVVLARHNHYMIELYNSIVGCGGRLVSIQTDAMTWIGAPISQMTTKKAMGNFCSEIVNGKVYQHHCGCYCIEDENQIIIKYQGVKNFPQNIDTMEAFIDFFTNNEIEIVDRNDAFDEDLKIKKKKVR